MYFFLGQYTFRHREKIFWQIFAILSRIYALFGVLGLNNAVLYQKLQISGMEEEDGIKCRGLFKFRKRLRESKCRFANLRISAKHTS